jgi:hypothetical protein
MRDVKIQIFYAFMARLPNPSDLSNSKIPFGRTPNRGSFESPTTHAC